MQTIEYRLRPVTRYVITRYEIDEKLGGIRTVGEYCTHDTAFEVAYALCRAEHERLGWAPGDERIIYPIALQPIGAEPLPIQPSAV